MADLPGLSALTIALVLAGLAALAQDSSPWGRAAQPVRPPQMREMRDPLAVRDSMRSSSDWA